MKISIHAPREGSDGEDVRGDPSFSFISIHAPREGSDAVIVYFLSFRSKFNPRSPRGERPDAPQRHNRTARFQSTLPARGATQNTLSFLNHARISIHAPREGSDLYRLQFAHGRLIFQSTLPARGATKAAYNNVAPRVNFNPRSPRGERQAR